MAGTCTERKISTISVWEVLLHETDDQGPVDPCRHGRRCCSACDHGRRHGAENRHWHCRSERRPSPSLSGFYQLRYSLDGAQRRQRRSHPSGRRLVSGQLQSEDRLHALRLYHLQGAREHRAGLRLRRSLSRQYPQRPVHFLRSCRSGRQRREGLHLRLQLRLVQGEVQRPDRLHPQRPRHPAGKALLQQRFLEQRLELLLRHRL